MIIPLILFATGGMSEFDRLTCRVILIEAAVLDITTEDPNMIIFLKKRSKRG